MHYFDFRQVNVVYSHLPGIYPLLVSKQQIMFVLMKMHEYFLRSEEQTINETAFLNLHQYILRESNLSRVPLSKSIVAVILQTEEQLYQA
jgi:hypothetical protein